MKKDLIVGCYTGYDWDKIKFWANSIDRCGFTGDKMMVVYHSDLNTAQILAGKNFKLYAFNQDPQTGNLYFPDDLIIVVRRFIDLWNFFSDMDLDQHRYVIHTDVKDVVFQTNPSTWLTNNMGSAQILASCESIQYQHEPWGNENMANSFPAVYPRIKDKPIWNCGVQAGIPTVMKDLWLNIFNMCTGNPVPNADQAAYNVLLNSEPYKSITKFAMSEDGWACQAGTSVDPSKMHTFQPHLIEPQPIWMNEMACTSNGLPHAVLHQYDRIPDWKPIVERKYS
jgi:hypothetical protein